jgi:hypothetical protein
VVTSNVDEKVAICLQELLTSKESTYVAESADELTGVLEWVSLYLEERQLEFQFAVNGFTVVFQLAE